MQERQDSEEFVCENQIDFVPDGFEGSICKFNIYINLDVWGWGRNLVGRVLASQSTPVLALPPRTP